MAKDKIIVVVGPTASGKSDLAIRLAKKINGEIISADSRQIYRGMDIGTGKVTRKQQKLVRHHLIDIASPKKIFTADDFRRLAQKALLDIAKRIKIPIIVGGTGFYIDILLGRRQTAQVPPNPKLRNRLDKFSTEHLFEMLRELDSKRAAAIDSKNKRRLVRALEIIDALGKVPSFAKASEDTAQSKYDVFWLGLKPKNLEKKIETRLDKRLKQGMVKEVQRLHKQGISWKRLYDFGLEYRWVSRYLRDEISYKKMRNSLLRDIVRYSKRQMTWFKKNKEIRWFGNAKEAYSFLSSSDFSESGN